MFLKKAFFLFAIFINYTLVSAQNNFFCIVKDARTLETMQNASVVLKGTSSGAASDSTGKALLKNIPGGKHKITISSIGYKEQLLIISFPLHAIDSVFEILMEQIATEEDQVKIGRAHV